MDPFDDRSEPSTSEFSYAAIGIVNRKLIFKTRPRMAIHDRA
eukprot:CAMPEP_0185771996 /NCGR_PEP_ID=MMETSP1174-20130828/66371_1 /TAXON_ID=35687 /ORGANISM="Dictyocha speculum, Strain CCMP1381" /LENGTH=41 /DNA_ID= /DNA_START= /DNA_END= /DNA_ORIENTATION=